MKYDSTLESDILHVMVSTDKVYLNSGGISKTLSRTGRYESIQKETFDDKVLGHLFFMKDQGLVDLVSSGSDAFRLTHKGATNTITGRTATVL